MRKQAPFLVVNDDPILQMALAQLLILEGYDVITADNPFEALTLCQQRPPGLVLIDLGSDGERGTDLASTIMERLERPPPVVVLTRLGDPQNDNPGDAILLSKPFQPELLLSVVHELTDGNAILAASTASQY